MDIGMRSLHPAAADHRVSIRGSRCTALIHPFASEPSGSGWSYCSPLPQRVFGERVRALRHSSGGHVVREIIFLLPAPLRASALKEHFSERAISLKEYHGWSRLFKDVLSPVCFWVWSFPGAQDGHDRCLTCLGIQHAEEAFVDGSCSSSKEKKKRKKGDHLGVAYRLRCVKHGGVPLPLPRFSVRPGTRGGAERWLRVTVRASQEEFLTPQALRSRWGCRWSGLGPLQNGVHHLFPSVLPLTTRCRSLHRRASSLSPGMMTRLRCSLRVW